MKCFSNPKASSRRAFTLSTHSRHRCRGAHRAPLLTGGWGRAKIGIAAAGEAAGGL
jgi:hypothetical protein